MFISNPHIFSFIVIKVLLLLLLDTCLVDCECGISDDMSMIYDCCTAPVRPLVVWADDSWAAVLFSSGLLMFGVRMLLTALLLCDPIGDTLHSSFVM